MANKKTTHGESKTQAKNNVQNPKKNEREHQRGKSSVEMNWKKGAGSPEMQPLFSRYTCRSLKKGKLISTTRKLKDLAEHIHEKEILYIPKHGGYKLMEVSSIETELCVIRRARKRAVGRGRKTGQRKDHKQVLTKIIVRMKCKLYF